VGLPPQFENGIVPDRSALQQIRPPDPFLDLRARRNVQTIDLGANHQMALEVRPHTIRFANTASSASWSTTTTSKADLDLVARGRQVSYREDGDVRPSRRRRTTAAAAAGFGAVRRW